MTGCRRDSRRRARRATAAGAAAASPVADACLDAKRYAGRDGLHGGTVRRYRFESPDRWQFPTSPRRSAAVRPGQHDGRSGVSVALRGVGNDRWSNSPRPDEDAPPSGCRAGPPSPGWLRSLLAWAGADGGAGAFNRNSAQELRRRCMPVPQIIRGQRSMTTGVGSVTNVLDLFETRNFGLAESTDVLAREHALSRAGHTARCRAAFGLGVRRATSCGGKIAR